MKCGGSTVLKFAEGLPEAKLLCGLQRPEDDRERVELSITSEMAEGRSSQRQTPPLTLRPVEDDGSIANRRK